MEFATHQWQKFTGSVPIGAVFGSEGYLVARGWHNDEWIPGKFHVSGKKAYVPWGGKEHEVHKFELLVAASGTTVRWVKALNGQVPAGAVGPVGKDSLYIGRAVCPAPESANTPGKIHPSLGKFYISWGGKEIEYHEYEALVIYGSLHNWVKPSGPIPANAVYACDSYVVIRGWHNKEWIPGKLHVTANKAYVPWGGKEISVHEYEVLVHAAGTTVEWVKASHGSIVEGTVGPIGKDGLYVGRAICPAPESKYTPGKVHPDNGKFYLSWGDKEHEYSVYEVLVIKRGFVVVGGGIRY